VCWIQAYPKGDKLDDILRQATELGVHSLHVVYTTRSVPKSRDDRAHTRMDRWKRIVEEAARQCGRSDVPTLYGPTSLETALQSQTPDVTLRLVAWENATQPLLNVILSTQPGATAVIAGPEGGLTPEEIALCASFHFTAVSLGPRILRAETVAPALLAILSTLRGDIAALQAR
jgi:16S rRNA (uracil1498-N3)-methyltransferase